MVDGLLDRWPITPDLLHQSVVNRQQIPSPIDIQIAASVADDAVNATITIVSADEPVNTNHRLRVALVNKTYDGWGGAWNGQDVYHYDMLHMAPDHNGLEFSIDANSTETFDVSFPWPVVLNSDTIAEDNIAIVAFVQKDGTREVLQSAVGEPSDGPVSFTLLPQNTTIPVGGGTLLYDVNLTSNLPNTVPGLTYWTTVTTPGGLTTPPLMTQPFTMSPFMDITVEGASQNVPGLAPAGTYTFTGHVGYMGTPTEVTSSFEFTKNGLVIDSYLPDPANWTGSFGTGMVTGDDAASASPNQFALHPAYPNPFNGQTTLSLTLPAASALSVTVHDITGRQVATIASGMHGAGEHAFTFDADDLATGLYLVRATWHGGEAVRKVMLVK